MKDNVKRLQKKLEAAQTRVSDIRSELLHAKLDSWHANNPNKTLCPYCLPDIFHAKGERPSNYPGSYILPCEEYARDEDRLNTPG